MTRTRFAPSPTWYLHIWWLRTALYNYLFAKQKWGEFLLRIEDTDRTRLVEGSLENIIKVLKNVWLDPDEWPHKQWKVWPYIQSERLDIYRKYVDELIKKGKAYYCFCSSDRLANLRKEQESLWLPTKYDRACRHLSKDEIKEKLDSWVPYTIRLKVPDDEKITFYDWVKWKIEIHSKDIDDQVLLKADWFPTYHLANVIDDHKMWITDVIRWDEWIPSTPKHILLYNAFWWDIPKFYHLPLLLWTDKKKLSKRTWDVSVESYLEKGYLVEALLNYILLLGWNPKTNDEFFSMQEMIEKFDPTKIHKSGAVFDLEKLNWMNSKYLSKMDANTVYEKLEKYLSEYDIDFYNNTFLKFDKSYHLLIIDELKSRFQKFDEYKLYTTFFYNDFEITKEIKEMLVNPKMKIDNIDIVKKWLKLALDILTSEKYNLDSLDRIKEIFVEKIKENEMKNWQVLWPVRVWLSWEQFSPGALELIYILPREKSIERLNKLLKVI